MNTKQAALIKLAQVRCAINHVLRMRAMQKQAEGNTMVNDFLSSDFNPLNVQRYRNFLNSTLFGLSDGLDRSIYRNTPRTLLYHHLTDDWPYKPGFNVGDAIPKIEEFVSPAGSQAQKSPASAHPFSSGLKKVIDRGINR